MLSFCNPSEQNFDTNSPVWSLLLSIISKQRLIHEASVWSFQTKKMSHLLLLILLSGQVELNPGPVDSHLSNSSFSESASCGICEHEVTNIGIYCDQGKTWFHQHCASVSDDTYYNILPRDSVSWICCLCGLPNHSTVSSLFANSNFESENSFRALANDDDTTCHRTWTCQTLRKPSPLAHQLVKKFLQGKHTSIETRNIN